MLDKLYDTVSNVLPYNKYFNISCTKGKCNVVKIKNETQQFITINSNIRDQ